MSVLAKAAQDVDITKIPPQQLMELAKAIEEEVRQLSSHFQQLQAATRKFEDSMGILAYMEQKATGKEVMVPLTSSLYVPGVMEQTNVLIEAGAGYFIEKDTPAAIKYCERKQKHMQESVTKVGELIQAKKMQLQKVSVEYQTRVTNLQA